MHRARSVPSLVVGLLLTLSAAAAEDVGRLSRSAGEAHRAADWPRFLELSRAIAAARPGLPAALVQLASAEARAGHPDEALRLLERVARMGLVVPAAQDEDFAALRPLRRFRRVVTRFERNARPAGRAAVAFRSGERGLIPEGLAFDPPRGRFLLGSVRQRTVYAVEQGALRPFARLPYGAFGMVADPARGALWVASTALPATSGFDAATERGRAALVRLDLATGAVAETHPAPAGDHSWGDVALGADGTVFVSDSRAPVIWALRDGTLAPFVEGPFVSLQGLAPSPDGRRLYAADYALGLFEVDLATRTVRALAAPRDACVGGIDGLYAVDARTLVGTQNGTTPRRIVRLRLAPDGRAIERVDVLLANHPELEEPTLGVVVNGAFHVNAAAQWDALGGGGQPDPAVLRDTVILRVPL